MGDFNLELQQKNDNSYNRKGLSIMAHEELVGRGMVQLIDSVTHRHAGRESTIDLIFTNEPLKSSKSGNIATGSSHDCVFTVRNVNMKLRRQEFMKRLYKRFDKQILIEEARALDWSYGGPCTSDEDELNSRVSDLEGKIRRLVDSHAPMKIFKADPLYMNWVSDGLKSKIDARNAMRRNLDRYGGSGAQWDK